MEVQGVTTVHTGISAGLIQGWTVMRTGVWKSTRKKKSSAGWKKKSKTGGTVMSVQWTEDQKKVIELRNRNILVSAAAGSGKNGGSGRADHSETVG